VQLLKKQGKKAKVVFKEEVGTVFSGRGNRYGDFRCTRLQQKGEGRRKGLTGGTARTGGKDIIRTQQKEKSHIDPQNLRNGGE